MPTPKDGASGLVLLTPAQLRELVREAVAEALDARATDSPVPLAQCGESIRSLRAAIRAGELNAHKSGRAYYVTRAELERWRSSKRVLPRERQPIAPDSPAQRAIERARQRGALRVVGDK